MSMIQPNPEVEISSPPLSVDDSRMQPLGVLVRETAALPVGPVDPVPASTVPSGEGTLRTTNLGLLLVQANHKASASSILAPTDQKASRTASAQYTQTIVASPPKSLPHAAIWDQAIDACKRSSSTLEVNGITLTKPSLVSMNDDGHLVEASLTSGLGAFSGDKMPVNVRAAPTMLQTSSTKSPSSQTTTVAPPATLTKPGIQEDSKSLTPQGFALAGGINLFGAISAQMYTFHGTASSGMDDLVVVTGGAANEPGTISAGSVIPSLKGTAVDDIQFTKTHLAYYSKPSPIDGRVGTWLEADVILQGSLRTLADDVHHFFDIEDPSVHVESNLGLARFWTETPRLPTFNLRISHLGLDHKFSNEITFTSAQVDITAQSSLNSPANKTSYEWSLGFSGDLKFALPGAIAPLLMNFHIQKSKDTFKLLFAMTGGSWQNAFGVRGLTITAIQFLGSYQRTQDAKNDVSFDIAATVDAGGTELDASGFYYNPKAWGFTLTLDTFDWECLCLLYQRLFPESGMQAFDHHEDVTVSDLVMSFSAGDETFTVSGKFKIHQFETAKATIVLSPTGISIKGELGDVKLDDVEIPSAELDLFIGKDSESGSGSSAGTSIRFHVTGSVQTINGLEVPVLVYFDKDPSGLLWTIYGRFQENHTLGSLSSTATGEMNFPLPNLAFVASNSSSPPSSLPTDFPYPVEKGIQLCATLGSFDWLNKALRSTHSNLMFQARYVQKELNIEIRLDAPSMKLSFAPNVQSGSLKVGIDLRKGESPILFIETDISITVANQPQPLDFVLRLDVNATSAHGTAELKSDWINPLGISQKLTIGQVVLQVGITYINEIYPSELGFGGHIAMGDTGGKVAIEITDDPREGLLVVELDEGKQLGLVDLVKFANTILEADRIPRPPSDYFIFEEFKLDVSTGVMFAGTYYPAGFMFKSQIELFGKKLAIDCEINKATRSIIAKGSIDNFTLGPLTIGASKNQARVTSGAASKPPSGPLVDLQFGETSQHVVVDGQVKLGSIADVAITLLAELGENPTFQFEAELDFMEHLQFTLEAEAKGDLSHLKKGAAGLDFALRAEFKSDTDIVKQIMAQLNTMLLAAKHSVDEGFGEANATLQKAEEAFQQGIKNAKNDLNAKSALWEAKNAKEQEAANKKKAEITAQGARLQKDVDDAKQAFDNFIKGLERDVTDAEQRMGTKIADAEKQVAKEQGAWDGKIDGARKSLADANAAMARDFGHADSAIESAEARVRAAQNDLGGINAQIDREQAAYNTASFFAKAGKKILIAGLEVQRGIKEAACQVVEDVLRAAKAVLDTVAYKSAQKLINTASDALGEIQKQADAALHDVNKALETVRTAEQSLCEAAKQKLENARTTCDQLKAWNAAKAALSTFVATETALYSTAAAGVLALESCAENIAYQAATVALKIAMANTHDIDIAKHAVSAVQDGADAFISVGEHMVNAAGNFVDVQLVQLSGSLNGFTDEHAPQPLDAKVQLVFVGKPHNFEVKYYPGAVADFVNQIFNECWAAVKKAI